MHGLVLVFWPVRASLDAEARSPDRGSLWPLLSSLLTTPDVSELHERMRGRVPLYAARADACDLDR
jgi:hypothetical protein